MLKMDIRVLTITGSYRPKLSLSSHIRQFSERSLLSFDGPNLSRSQLTRTKIVNDANILFIWGMVVSSQGLLLS
jgi:hypothetical protein